MGTWIIIGIVIVFGLWIFVPLYKENGKRGNEDEYTDDKLRHIADSAFETENLKKLKEKLDHMDYLYESAQVNRESERTLENIRFHRADVRDAYEDVLETKWEEKMQPIIDDLDNYISMVLEDGQHGFMDIDDVIGARDKALRLYDKYWKTGSAFNGEHNCNFYVRGFLMEHTSWKAQLDSRWQLQQALDAAIEPLKPEQKRKKKLYQAVTNCVAAEGSIQRSVLLKKEFPDATAEEVRYCYRELIRKYKLVEYKMGNRWFVTLADKEKERREKAAARKTAKKAEEPKETES